jgi:hypothetical protein
VEDTRAVELEGVECDCGGHYCPAVQQTLTTIAGVVVEVPSHFFRCDACGEERMTTTQLGDMRRAAANAAARGMVVEFFKEEFDMEVPNV